MKYFLLLYLTSLLISCSADDYKVEDELYACLSEKAKIDGIDLEKEVAALEQLFVNANYLNDKSGQAKLDYFDTVVSRQQIAIPGGGLESFQKVSMVFRQWKSCVDAHKMEGFKESKFGRLQQRIKEALEKQGSYSVSKIAAIFGSELSAKDMEHPFFRTMALVILGNALLEKDTAYLRKIPQRIEPIENSEYFAQFAFRIEVNANNELRVNDSLCDLQDIEQLVIPYIRTMHEVEEHHIRIKVSQKTLYSAFVGIHDAIESAYHTVLDERSMKTYQKSFDTLTDEQQMALKAQYPNRIVEVRPQ